MTFFFYSVSRQEKNSIMITLNPSVDNGKKQKAVHEAI